MDTLKSKKNFILLNIAFIVLTLLRFTNYIDNFVSSILLVSIMLVNVYIFFYLEIKYVKISIKAIIFIVSAFMMLLILTLINARELNNHIDKTLFFICVLIPNIIYSTSNKTKN